MSTVELMESELPVTETLVWLFLSASLVSAGRSGADAAREARSERLALYACFGAKRRRTGRAL